MDKSSIQQPSDILKAITRQPLLRTESPGLPYYPRELDPLYVSHEQEWSYYPVSRSYPETALPLLGPPGVPSQVVNVIPDAGPTGINAIKNPIDGTTIDKDVLGNLRWNPETNRRDIGAIQLNLSPHIQVTSTDNQSASLSWSQPMVVPYTGAAPLSGYELCYGDGSLPDNSVAVCPGTSRSISGADTTVLSDLTGLTNGQPYWFMIRGDYGTTPGTWSNVAVGVPYGPVGTPVLTAVAEVGAVRLYWTEPAWGGHPVDAPEPPPTYTIVFRPKGQGSGEWFPGPTLVARTTDIPGLTNGTEYEFAVFANTADGATSPAAGSATATPFNAPAFTYPPSVTAYENNAISISPFLAQTSGTDSFAIISGTLPSGLSLDAATGVISGTPNAGSAAGSPYPVTVRMTQTGGQPAIVEASITINVVSNPPQPYLYYPDLIGVVGSGPVTQTQTVAGFTETPTYSVVGEALPQGLVLNADGSISGIPQIAGSFATTIRAESGAQLIQEPLIIMISPTLSYGVLSGEVGTSVSLPPNVSPVAQGQGGAYSLTSGTLPNGLVLNPQTGVISGIPAEWGSTTVTVTFATDTTTTQAAVLISISRFDFGFTYPPAKATIGNPFSLTPQVNTIGAKTYALTGGSLPPGLSLNPSTGVVSGTPMGSAGTYVAVVTITNQYGSQTAPLLIEVSQGAPAPNPIPTQSEWAQIAMTFLMALSVGWYGRRRMTR